MAKTSSSLNLQIGRMAQQDHQSQLRCWIQFFVAFAVAETEEERRGKITYQPKYSPYNVEFAGDAKAQEAYFTQQGSLKRDLNEYLSFLRLRHALSGLADLMDLRRMSSLAFGADNGRLPQLDCLDNKLLEAFQEVYRTLNSLRAARTRIGCQSQGMAWEGLIDSVGSFACRLTDNMPSEDILTSHAIPGEETNRSNIGSEDLEFLEQHRLSLRKTLSRWTDQSKVEAILMKQRLESVWRIANVKDEWARAYLDSSSSAS
ncbi:MAG: hypothetical protein Q9212_005131 [Teloschistes hypoglaucus]